MLACCKSQVDAKVLEQNHDGSCQQYDLRYSISRNDYLNMMMLFFYLQDISPSHSIAPRVPNPTERSMPTEQPSHNADLVSQQPRIPNINNPPITTHNANTQPVASHDRSNQPIASQYDHSQSGTHNQVTSQSAVNVHHSIQSNNSQHQQQHQQDVPSASQQRPDLLQHDVSMSRSQNQNNIQPLPVRQSTGMSKQGVLVKVMTWGVFQL